MEHDWNIECQEGGRGNLERGLGEVSQETGDNFRYPSVKRDPGGAVSPAAPSLTHPSRLEWPWRRWAASSPTLWGWCPSPGPSAFLPGTEPWCPKGSHRRGACGTRTCPPGTECRVISGGCWGHLPSIQGCSFPLQAESCIPDSGQLLLLFFFFFKDLFIYFCLCQVFVAVPGLSLVAGSRGYSPAAASRLFTVVASLEEHRLSAE